MRKKKDFEYLECGDIVQVRPDEIWSRKCMALCGQQFICEVLHQSDGDIADTCYRVRPITEEVRRLCAERKLSGVNGDESGAFDIYKGYLMLLKYAKQAFTESEFDSFLED